MPDNKTLYVDSNIASNNMATTIDESTAIEADVKDGYVFKSTPTGEQRVGSMPDNGSIQIDLEPQNEDNTNFSSYTIPKGFHDGTGRVSVGYLKEYTEGTADENEIAEGKVAWVNGKKIVGLLDISQAKQEANATAEDIAYGKYAWANGEKINGTVPVLFREDKTLKAGESYTVPYGIAPKDGIVVSAAGLNVQTSGTATASDIAKDKTAWVNGIQITGTFDKASQVKEWVKESTATKDKVLTGYTFYSGQYGDIVDGTMEDHTGEDTRVLKPGDTFAIPQGYYDGNVSIAVQNIHDATIASAVPSNILKDKTAWVNGEKITGTMEYNELASKTIEAGEEYIIPEGYHTGTEKVVGDTLANQTVGDAIAENIYEGKTAWVDGVQITGSMQDAGAVSIMLSAGEHYHIPQGYHDGAGNVYAKSIGDQTQGDAIASDLIKDKIAWVNGNKIIGTMSVNTGAWIELDPSTSYIIPKGYHPGTGMVISKSIEDATTGTATSEDILKDKTAWVDGEKITGTVELKGTANPAQVLSGYTFYNTDAHTKLEGLLTLEGNAADNQVIKGATFYTNDATKIHTGTLELSGNAFPNSVLEGYSFYSDDPFNKLEGAITKREAVDKIIKCGETYTVEPGFYANSSIITGDTLYNQTQATANANTILENETAWVNGEKIVGAIPIQTGATQTISAGSMVTIKAGYYPTDFTITALDLATQTQGNATADDVVIAKTAWVNGTQITGAIADGDSMTF